MANTSATFLKFTSVTFTQTVISSCTVSKHFHKLFKQNGAVQPSLKVTEAWSRGYNGQGITIAVVDNGVQTDHPDLMKRFVSVVFKNPLNVKSTATAL